MKRDTLYTATKWNQAALGGLLDSTEKETEDYGFFSSSEPSQEKKRPDNKLHTVNKYNKKKFIPADVDKINQNIFDGENTSYIQNAKSAYTGGDYSTGSVASTTGVSGGSSFGSAFKSAVGNTFSGAGIGNALGSALTGGIGGISGGIASAVGGTIGNLISNGYSSTAGDIMNTVGDVVGAIPGIGTIAGAGLKILSGGVNALFGTKVDQAKLQAANKGTLAYNSFTSNAGTFDDIKMAQAQEGVQDAYSGGAFRKGWAEERNKRLHDQRIDARQFASRAVANNISNLTADQLNDALANFSAFGGKIARRKALKKKIR